MRLSPHEPPRNARWKSFLKTIPVGRFRRGAGEGVRGGGWGARREELGGVEGAGGARGGALAGVALGGRSRWGVEAGWELSRRRS